MSKTTNMNRRCIRWNLLVTVSTIALVASAYGAGEAEAADNDGDRPLLWIELGGQLDRLSASQELFTPSFIASVTQRGLLSALNVQHQPALEIGSEGKITFQPHDSGWVISASIRYGRSQSAEHHHHQTPNALVPVHFSVFGKYKGGYSLYPSGHVKLSDGTASQNERHLVLDFQAGKDVGLGIFGSGGTSVVNAGVRFAQFTSKSNIALRAVPDVQYKTAPITSFTQKYYFEHPTQIMHFHAYTGIANIQRSFRGVGPSLSWNASAPFAGNADAGEMSFDWGVNAAILFGRQKVKGSVQSTKLSYTSGGSWVSRGGVNPAIHNGVFYNCLVYGGGNCVHLPPQRSANTENLARTRSVTVPNVGGFAGLSYRIEDFKVSLGYRADFFFGAMDGGIDAVKKENVGFNGPYASISVGLGD